MRTCRAGDFVVLSFKGLKIEKYLPLANRGWSGMGDLEVEI